MDNNVKGVVDLKDSVEKLALAVLGQHAWALRVEAASARRLPPSACFCKVCTLARKLYQRATGNRPSAEAEEQATNDQALAEPDFLRKAGV